jgi:hypothetical protein
MAESNQDASEVSPYPPPPSYYVQDSLTPPEPPPSEPSPASLPSETSAAEVRAAVRQLASSLPLLTDGSEDGVARAVAAVQNASSAISGRRPHQAARALAEAIEQQTRVKHAAAAKVEDALQLLEKEEALQTTNEHMDMDVDTDDP